VSTPEEKADKAMAQLRRIATLEATVALPTVEAMQLVMALVHARIDAYRQRNR
jgi:hypothetical protein